jgi:hypothetical protein
MLKMPITLINTEHSCRINRQVGSTPLPILYGAVKI